MDARDSQVWTDRQPTGCPVDPFSRRVPKSLRGSPTLPVPPDHLWWWPTWTQGKVRPVGLVPHVYRSKQPSHQGCPARSPTAGAHEPFCRVFEAKFDFEERSKFVGSFDVSACTLQQSCVRSNQFTTRIAWRVGGRRTSLRLMQCTKVNSGISSTLVLQRSTLLSSRQLSHACAPIAVKCFVRASAVIPVELRQPGATSLVLACSVDPRGTEAHSR